MDDRTNSSLEVADLTTVVDHLRPTVVVRRRVVDVAADRAADRAADAVRSASHAASPHPDGLAGRRLASDDIAARGGTPSGADADRFGPDRFGPDRFGPDRFGADRFGPEGLGPASMRPASLGADSLGADSLGPDSLRPDSLGPDSLGPDSLGPDSPGPDSLGPDSVGPDSLALDSAGPESLGAYSVIPERLLASFGDSAGDTGDARDASDVTAAGDVTARATGAREAEEGARATAASVRLVPSRPRVELGPTVSVQELASLLGVEIGVLAADLVTRGFFEVTAKTAVSRRVARTILAAQGIDVADAGADAELDREGDGEHLVHVMRRSSTADADRGPAANASLGDRGSADLRGRAVARKASSKKTTTPSPKSGAKTKTATKLPSRPKSSTSTKPSRGSKPRAKRRAA